MDLLTDSLATFIFLIQSWHGCLSYFLAIGRVYKSDRLLCKKGIKSSQKERERRGEERGRKKLGKLSVEKQIFNFDAVHSWFTTFSTLWNNSFSVRKSFLFTSNANSWWSLMRCLNLSFVTLTFAEHSNLQEMYRFPGKIYKFCRRNILQRKEN